MQWTDIMRCMEVGRTAFIPQTYEQIASAKQMSFVYGTMLKVLY